MNYKKIYDNLVLRGKNRILDSYTETHHIIPRCVGGSNDVENLVKLTPEEHYLAHQLLIKIYNGNHSLIRAAMMMRCNRPTNKLYGWLRRKYALIASAAQTGTRNTQYGTKWIHSKLLQENKKIKFNEEIPIGWETGRIINFDAYFKKQELKTQKIEKVKLPKELTKEQKRKKIKTKHFNFRKTEGYRKAKSKKLFKEFKNSGLSLRQFAKNKQMVPMTLSKWFNEFIDEYKVVARKAANKQL